MARAPLPDLYEQAFSRGQVAFLADKSLRISVVRVGILALPSGRIVACDPLVGREREPFVQAVLPGRYPVDLSLGHDAVKEVERTLFARILFTKNKPVVWVKALREIDVAAGTGEDGPFGFTVSSGTAAFMDQETADLFRLDSMDEVDQFLDRLVSNFRPERSWLNHAVDEQHNVILFSTDQVSNPIPSYFAIDEDGDVCLALTRLFA